MNEIFMLVLVFGMRMTGGDAIMKAKLKMYSQNCMAYENWHCMYYGKEEFCSFDSGNPIS